MGSLKDPLLTKIPCSKSFKQYETAKYCANIYCCRNWRNLVSTAGCWCWRCAGWASCGPTTGGSRCPSATAWRRAASAPSATPAGRPPASFGPGGVTSECCPLSLEHYTEDSGGGMQDIYSQLGTIHPADNPVSVSPVSPPCQAEGLFNSSRQFSFYWAINKRVGW